LRYQTIAGIGSFNSLFEILLRLLDYKIDGDKDLSILYLRCVAVHDRPVGAFNSLFEMLGFLSLVFVGF